MILAGHAGDLRVRGAGGRGTRASQARCERIAVPPRRSSRGRGSWTTTRAERRLTMYATTQNPHPLRTTLAAALRLDERRVRIVAPRSGGSFGLKMYGNREDFIAAVMAIAAARPVRWVEDARGLARRARTSRSTAMRRRSARTDAFGRCA